MADGKSVDYMSEVAEVADKGGWLWKYSVGKSFFSRKNWKMRYLIISLDGVAYFAQEPFDTPKGQIRWDDVTHVYPNVNSDVDPGADDPKMFYFGLRFNLSPGNEKLLLLRVDTGKERDGWVNHLQAMRNEYNRVQMLVDTEDEDDDGTNHSRASRRAIPKRGAIMEKIAVKLRTMVSLKKQRFKSGGFDLDLAYITPQIIAMGFPSEGREAVYRNPMDQVVSFLNQRHAGHYMVLNLCSERSYPPSRFNGRFLRFPFDDHNPCPLEMLLPMCQEIQKVLNEGFTEGSPSGSPREGDLAPTTHSAEATFPDVSAATVEILDKTNAKFEVETDPEARQMVLNSHNVVAIHCKAGKGRTGLVICAYLIFSGLCPTAPAALKFFGDQRTKDGKGVQIPSQKRYLAYFETLLRDYNDTVDFPPIAKICLRTVTLSHVPHFDPDGGCDPYIVIQKRKQGHAHVPCGTKEGSFKDNMCTVYDSREGHPVKHVSGKTKNFSIPLMRHFEGELLVTLFDHDVASRDDRMCAFWIHTGFLPANGQYVMRKHEIDDAVKDKKDELFHEDFHITLDYSFEDGFVPRPRAATMPVQHRRSFHKSKPAAKPHSNSAGSAAAPAQRKAPPGVGGGAPAPTTSVSTIDADALDIL